MITRTIRGILKGAAVFLGLAGAIALLHAFGLDSTLDTAWIDSHIRDHGLQGHLLYIGIAGVLTALAVPRQFVSFLGGYAFGAAFGTLWATVGATLGCMLTFFYARFAGQSLVNRRFSHRVARVNAFLSRNPFTMTFIFRCLPVGNNVLTNLIAGVSSIPAVQFFAGSFIGYIPQHFIFALLGSGVHVSPVLRTVTSALLFVLSSVFGYMLYRRYRIDRDLEETDDQ